MHPLELEPELTVTEAATLIASVNGGDATIPLWKSRLEKVIKSGELQLHDRQEPMPAYMDFGEPWPTWTVQRLLREDVQRFCAENGITSPYAESPSSPLAAQDIPSQRLAEFERFCEGLDDAKLFGWKKSEFLAALRARPSFTRLKTPNSLDHFWREARPVLKRVRAARSPRRRR